MWAHINGRVGGAPRAYKVMGSAIMSTARSGRNGGAPSKRGDPSRVLGVTSVRTVEPRLRGEMTI